MSVPDSCQAVVAIGSNLGNSGELIEKAIEQVSRFSEAPVLRSSLWRSSPVDCPPGSPDFVNAVVVITPGLTDTPQNLLGRLQEIERQLGRTPKRVANEARPIDLDLISYGDRTSRSDHLTLPHPRAHQRRFVLAPLVEVLPDHRAPGWTGSASDLLDRLKNDSSNGEVCARMISK